VETIQLLFNGVLVVFIVATMLSAGLSTTFEQVRGVLSHVGLVVAVLVVGFVLRPLIGWGTAELFSLAAPAYIAMVLVWSCPGAPFGAKLVMTAKADVQSGAVLQVLLASIGSLTFAPTANAIIAGADLGGDFSLPVGDLVKTVAFLQLVPFAVGILMRHWTPDRAMELNRSVAKASSFTFIAVLAGALLGSWKTIVGLVGSEVLLAAILASVLLVLAGYFIASGDRSTRSAAALIQPCSNSGPCFAAVAIAFDNDPAILGAITAILALQIVVGLLASSWAGREPAP
jgi:BASS family bile acid:Na+ symporter